MSILDCLLHIVYVLFPAAIDNIINETVTILTRNLLGNKLQCFRMEFNNSDAFFRTCYCLVACFSCGYRPHPSNNCRHGFLSHIMLTFMYGVYGPIIDQIVVH